MTNALDNRNVIRDGMELPGYIAATPGVHGECRFKYRPMLAEHVEEVEYQRDVLHDKPKESTKLIAENVTKQVVAWGEVDQDGNAIAVTLDAIMHLRHQVLGRMYRIIAGLTASDKDPSGDDGEPVSLRESLGNY